MHFKLFDLLIFLKLQAIESLLLLIKHYYLTYNLKKPERSHNANKRLEGRAWLTAKKLVSNCVFILMQCAMIHHVLDSLIASLFVCLFRHFLNLRMLGMNIPFQVSSPLFVIVSLFLS